MGETGIRLVLHRLSPSRENADRLAELIAANAQDERREVMWGSPGTMLAAAAMHELTGEARWLDLWRESAAWLRDEWDPQTDLWTQQLYGTVEQYHRPCARVRGLRARLARDADDELHRRAAKATARYAVEEDGLANWPPVSSMESLRRNRDGSIRAAVVSRRARCRRVARPLRARRRRAWAVAARGRRAHLAGRPAVEGSEPLPRHGRQRLCLPGAPRAHGGRAVARACPRVRDALGRPGRPRTRGARPRPLHPLDAAIQERRSTSPTAWPAAEPFRCPDRRPRFHRGRNRSNPVGL